MKFLRYLFAYYVAHRFDRAAATIEAEYRDDNLLGSLGAEHRRLAANLRVIAADFRRSV